MRTTARPPDSTPASTSSWAGSSEARRSTPNGLRLRPGPDLGDDPPQPGRIDGFHEVAREAGRRRPVEIFLLSVARDGDERGAVQARLAHPRRDRVTIHARQPDVEQHEVGTFG